ncbi:BPI protein, partial [Atractosteus spatula]|nr:BPI protein [Atractosteus spatula]
MWKSLLLLLAIAQRALGAFGANPGVKAMLTSKGLEYGKHVGANLLQEKLGALSIPAVQGDISISPFGSVHFSLDSMQVSKFNLPEPTVEFSEGSGIKTGLAGMNIAVHGNWHTSYQFIKDGGTFDLAVYGVGISLLLSLGSDEAGHLSVSSSMCDSTVGSTDVSFHGGASFIFSLFIGEIRRVIQQKIETSICPMITQSVDGLERHLQEMNVSFQIDPYVLIEIPLLSAPLVGNSDMELDLKGEFYSTRGHPEPPFPAGAFSLAAQEGRMLALGLSEFFFNSAAFAYMAAGLLQVNLTDSMLPKTSPVHLNTSSFGAFVPQLPKMFPNMLMTVQAFASKPPVVSLQPDNVTMGLSGAAKVFAILPNSSLAPLFTLESEASLDAKVFISDMKLTGSLALRSLTLTLAASEVGEFQTTPLENLLKMGVQTVVLPKVNEKLKAGFPIPPIYNISCVDPVLKVNQGFVTIATDAQYSS